MIARPRRGVTARHFLEDLQPYTAACTAVLALGAIASVAAAPVMLDRSGAASAARDLPAPISRLLGIEVGRSLDTGMGHLNATFLSVVLPVALILLGIVGASRAIAGSAATGELEMLVANPVSRHQLVAERFLAVVGALLQAALPAIVIVAIGSQLGQIDVGAAIVIGAGIKALILASLIAAITMIASAVSSNPIAPTIVGLVVTAGSFAVVAADMGPFSPVQLAIGDNPARGGAWVGAAVVLVIAGWAAAIATVAFDRRDIV